MVCTWSDDDGETWSTPILVAEFGNHSVCPNAAVYDRETDTVHVLYNVFQWGFTAPASRKPMAGRECRQFHQVSQDGGRSWPRHTVLVEDEFAYSSLVQLADGRIGLFCEARGHRDIVLRRFELQRLLGPR